MQNGSRYVPPHLRKEEEEKIRRKELLKKAIEILEEDHMAKVKKGPGSPRTTPLSPEPGKRYPCTPLKPYNGTKEAEELALLQPPLPNDGSNPFKEPFNINQREENRLNDQAERERKRREEVKVNYNRRYIAAKSKFFVTTKLSSPVGTDSSTEVHERTEKDDGRTPKVSSLISAQCRGEEEEDKDVMYVPPSSIRPNFEVVDAVLDELISLSRELLPLLLPPTPSPSPASELISLSATSSVEKRKGLEETRAELDAQRKKQKKEDREESRRKLQPARKPFDNGVHLAGSCMEKNTVLKRPLSTDGSHPYKDVPYESGDHVGRTEMKIYREFGEEDQRTVSTEELSSKAVSIEIPRSVLLPPPPPNIISSLSASTSAPSSILPSPSAAAAATAAAATALSVSEGWSSRLERQEPIQSLELEPQALSSVMSPESSSAPAIVVRDDPTLSASSSATIEVLSRKTVSIDMLSSLAPSSSLPSSSSDLNGTEYVPSYLRKAVSVDVTPTSSWNDQKKEDQTTSALALSPLPLLLPQSNKSLSSVSSSEMIEKLSRKVVSIEELLRKAPKLLPLLLPPRPPSLLFPPSNKFLSSISSSSASASKGRSSRHERPRKEDPEMETEDSKMRREKEDESVPLASTLSLVLLNEEAPPSMIASNIREDNNKVTTNLDQPSAESLLALAPEPLPLSLPRLNESAVVWSQSIVPIEIQSRKAVSIEVLPRKAPQRSSVGRNTSRDNSPSPSPVLELSLLSNDWIDMKLIVERDHPPSSAPSSFDDRKNEEDRTPPFYQSAPSTSKDRKDEVSIEVPRSLVLPPLNKSLLSNRLVPSPSESIEGLSRKEISIGELPRKTPPSKGPRKDSELSSLLNDSLSSNKNGSKEEHTVSNKKRVLTESPSVEPLSLASTSTSTPLLLSFSPTNDLLSLTASSSAPSSILPSASSAASASASAASASAPASEGCSSRLERQASIQSLELVPSALSSLPVSSSVSIEVLSTKTVSIDMLSSVAPLSSSPISIIDLSTKTPAQWQLAPNIREDDNKVTTSFVPPSLSAFLESLEMEPVENKSFDRKKDNNFTVYFITRRNEKEDRWISVSSAPSSNASSSAASSSILSLALAPSLNDRKDSDREQNVNDSMDTELIAEQLSSNENARKENKGQYAVSNEYDSSSAPSSNASSSAPSSSTLSLALTPSLNDRIEEDRSNESYNLPSKLILALAPLSLQLPPLSLLLSDISVPLASALPSVLLNAEAPQSMIASIIREDNNKVSINFDQAPSQSVSVSVFLPPSRQISIQSLELEPARSSSSVSSNVLSRKAILIDVQSIRTLSSELPPRKAGSTEVLSRNAPTQSQSPVSELSLSSNDWVIANDSLSSLSLLRGSTPTSPYNYSPLLIQQILLKNNNINNNNNLLNDNNNKVWNELIFMDGKRMSQILETTHGTKYTATTNQSNVSGPTTKYRTTVTDQNTSQVNTGIISNQRSKLLVLKFLDESWESSPRPKISEELLVVKTKRPVNDTYAYAPVDTSILKITFSRSQNLISVSKITKKNNNNCRESNNNNNNILQPTRTDFIKYLQLEPEPQQLPSNSNWIYRVIQFVNLLCLLKLLSQQNTSRNDIVIYSYSDTLSYIYNKFKNETSFKFKRDHHISHIKPESTAFFSAPLTVYKFYREFRFCKCGKVLV